MLISPTFSSKAKTTPLGQNGPCSRSLPTYAGLLGALLKLEYSLRDSRLPTGFPLFIDSYSLYPRLSPPLAAVRRASCLSGRSTFASWPLFCLDLGYKLQQIFLFDTAENIHGMNTIDLHTKLHLGTEHHSPRMDSEERIQ